MNGNEGALQNLMVNHWNIGAYLGYVIQAMNNLDYEPNKVRSFCAC
ncbi:MAG: hypothetical protein E6Y08_23470 [Paenibacillus sp.]|nr:MULTISPECIES: hypothetical protein [unclassified Paenibacillus]MDU4698771.1 hypothetical protein [Paenibacillus sp.]GIP30873.1 hypothetical protein J2TS4_00830 [Paenibacillus sp. J2TS4]